MPESIIPNFNNDYAGGINLRDAPIGLGAGELILSENIEPVASGGVRGRGGQTEYNATPIDANPIRSLYRFYKQGATGLTLATSGTKVYRGADLTGVMTEIDSGYTADKKFSFVTWTTKDKVYWINGIEVLKNYDGTTVAVTPGSPPVGSQVELHDDRLWILQDTGVRFSALNVDNSWPATNLINLVDKHGGTGKFIKSFGRGLLIIAKDTGLYRFEGSPNLGGKMVRYSDIGCVAPWTAAVTPAGVIFLAMDGLHLTNGFEDQPISGKVDPLFTIPLRTAVGEYYAKKRQYFFAFNPTAAANNDLYVATALESEGGNRVSWNRYTNFNAESFSVWNGPGDLGQIFYGRSDEGTIRRADIGSQDVGVDYAAKFQTPWYDMGNKLINKNVRWLYPVFESLRPVTYQVGYTFGKSGGSGQAQPNSASGVTWGPGSVIWGPGTVIWSITPPVTERKESVLFLHSGRHFSFTLQNIGDGLSFKFYGLGYEAKTKPGRHFEPFAIVQQQM